MHKSIFAALFLLSLASSPLRAADALCATPDVKASLAKGGGTTIIVWARNAAKGGGTVVVVWPRSASTEKIAEDVGVAVMNTDATVAGNGNAIVVWPFAASSEAKAADCGASTVMAWPLQAPRQTKRSPGNGNTVVIWPKRETPLDNGIVVVWSSANGRTATVTWPVVEKFPVRCSDGHIAVSGTCADGGGTTVVIWP